MAGPGGARPNTGGKRANSGRPKGALNRKTRERVEAVEASGLTPLDYMLSVMRDETNAPLVRLDAAKSAAPYVHAKLSTIDAKITGDLAHTIKRIEREIVDPANPDS